MAEDNIKEVLRNFDYVKELEYKINLTEENKMLFPPGHVNSPIVALDEIRKREQEIWQEETSESIPGIKLNRISQQDLVKSFSTFYREIPFNPGKKRGLRYYFENEFYSYCDGIFLYSMLRKFQPKRVIEIGSGFSSALMLDTSERFLANNTEFTFVEPHLQRSPFLINEKSNKRVEIYEAALQDVDLSIFSKLELDDFLVIDSSHVVKTHSDLVFIFFHILPHLKSGVIIHFHDIFFPFEYPKGWVYEGRNWNEAYFLRCFLMYNPAFDILLFSDFLHQVSPEVFATMPLCKENTGGSFWIRKT